MSKQYKIISGTHTECEKQLDDLNNSNMVVVQQMVNQQNGLAILISLTPTPDKGIKC